MDVLDFLFRQMKQDELSKENLVLALRVSILESALEHQNQVIAELVSLVEEGREAINELTEGHNALAVNQAVFYDNFKMIGYINKTGGVPGLPATMPGPDDDLPN